MLTQIHEVSTPQEARSISEIGVDRIGVLVGNGDFPREFPRELPRFVPIPKLPNLALTEPTVAYLKLRAEIPEDAARLGC